MYIGHYAPALVAATHKESPSLPVLFVAVQLVDIGFFAFLLTGTEHMRIAPGISRMNAMDLYDLPYTHSLIGACVWALGFALILRAFKCSWTGALIGAACVVSHWFLDLLVHVPDLTLAGSAPKLGLGLWNHPMIEMPLEVGITLAAAIFYVRRMKVSLLNWRWLALIALLLGLQAFNWLSAPPKQVEASISYMAFLGYTLPTLFAWLLARSTKGQARLASAI